MKIKIKENHVELPIEKREVEMVETTEVIKVYTVEQLDAIISSFDLRIEELQDRKANCEKIRGKVLEEVSK